MRPIIEASILKRNSLHNHNMQQMPCDLTGDLKILPAVDDSAAVFAMERVPQSRDSGRLVEPQEVARWLQ